MRQGFEQRTEQRMLLLPRMLQSIEVLHLPAQELELYLREAYEGNESLRLVERRRSASRFEAARGLERSAAHDELLQQQPARAPALSDVLRPELALLELDASERAWLELLVGCLDERGYLSASDAELLALAQEQGLEGGARELGLAIARLQRLEPRGIGARDLVEALLLQLDTRAPNYALLCTLIERHLDDVARNKLPRVARALGIELPRLRELLEELRALHPTPASGLVGVAAPTLRPEVRVRWSRGRAHVSVDHSGLPELSIDPVAQALARDARQPRELRAHLRERMGAARALIEAVGQRRRTLQRICAALFARQSAFLEHGPGRLAPLRMGELADALGMHASTVSRAVAGKHALTPWGILPLRGFFQAASGERADGARTNVRELVRELVAAEDARRPLSDDELAAELARRGFKLARRTVAKFREELGIPSSYRRRQFAA